jgi:hypothetical protein
MMTPRVVQRVVGRRRFGLEYVESQSGEVPILERRDRGLEIEQAAASDVHDHRPRIQAGYALGVDAMRPPDPR